MWLGKIVDEKMILNKFGNVVQNIILDLPKYYKWCEIWEYVIMPNHLHVIMIIHDTAVGDDLKSSHGLWEIIRSLKWFSSRKINKIQDEFYFQRQRSYHDRIIRNEYEYEKIVKYIKLNPYKRKNDEYYC